MSVTFNVGLYSKLFIITSLVFSLVACKDGKKGEGEDSKEIAEEFNKAKFKNSKEAKFMVNAAEICYKEIELARLAQSNGTNDNLKEIGKMMEKDHSQFLTELKELALTKQVTLPETTTESGQNARTRLADKEGIDFDKQYCEMVVDNHKEAIKEFMKAQEDCEDTEVKNWATKSLVTLRTHLDYAMTCKEAYKGNAQPDERAFKKDSLKSMEKSRNGGTLNTENNKNNNSVTSKSKSKTTNETTTEENKDSKKESRKEKKEEKKEEQK